MLRYSLAVGLLLIVVAVLQVSLFSRFRLFGVVPDLMLGTVLFLAFFCGQYTGAISGIAAGFLIEAIGTHGITLLPVIYLFFGYLTGHYARSVIPKNLLSYLPYLAVGVVVRAATTLLYACLTYQSIDLPKLLLGTLLPEALTTGVCAVLLYFPGRLFCRFLEKKH